MFVHHVRRHGFVNPWFRFAVFNGHLHHLRILADRLSDGRRPFKSIRDATADLKTCAFCGIQNEYMKRCSGCHWARYCSRKCMENDWPQHKGACSPDERFPVNVEGIPYSGGRDVFPAAVGHVTLYSKTCAFCGIEKVHSDLLTALLRARLPLQSKDARL